MRAARLRPPSSTSGPRLESKDGYLVDSSVDIVMFSTNRSLHLKMSHRLCPSGHKLHMESDILLYQQFPLFLFNC